MLRPGPPAVLAAVLAAAAMIGCGSDAEDRYASTWNDACRAVAGASRDLQTSLAEAADASPDGGDRAAARPLPGPEVARDAGPAAAALVAAHREQLDAVRDVRPPAELDSWHREAVARLERQQRILAEGAARLRRGDADGIAALAVGGFGPARADAPPRLRDETPSCTGLQ